MERKADRLLQKCRKVYFTTGVNFLPQKSIIIIGGGKNERAKNTLRGFRRRLLPNDVWLKDENKIKRRGKIKDKRG